MWVKISDWLHKFSTGWAAIAGLVIFLVFTATVLPNQAAQADATSGGADTPDLSFYYSPQELYQMAEVYGEEGRQEYIRVRFTFDLFWPIVYSLFLVTSISWLTKRGFASDSIWQRANLVPLLAMILDYFENISTSLVMYRFPARTPAVDFLAPIFTSIKWILVGGSFVLLLVAIGAVNITWVRRRNSAQK